MDYLEYYGVTQEPFSTAPCTRFYYNADPHSRALTRLTYAASTMKGLALLVGDIGTGKTTLARRMLDSLTENEYEAGLLVIIHSGITPDWLLRRIALQLGVSEPPSDKLELLSNLYRRLVDIHEQGRKAVVLIDEAQMLRTKEIMEEFRGLLNIELEESKLITFILFALPEIEQYMKLDLPLFQRVAMKYRLDAFDKKTTDAYIRHRLELAGCRKILFTDDAMAEIFRFSRGIPRLINTICDNSLFEGYILKDEIIDASVIKTISTDLGIEKLANDAAETEKRKRLPEDVESALDNHHDLK